MDIDNLTPEQLQALGYRAWNHEGSDNMGYVQCPGGFIETIYLRDVRNPDARWQIARDHLKDMIAAIAQLAPSE